MKNTKYTNRDVKGIIYGKVIYGRTRHEERVLMRSALFKNINFILELDF